MTYTEIILNAFERTTRVNSIYTNFSNRFDRITHDVMVDMNLNISVVGWLQASTSAFPVLSGVPQGFYCGPFPLISL